MLKKIGCMVVAIILSATFLLPSNNAGAISLSCNDPEDDGSIWYIGGSVTKVGTLEPGETYEGLIEACSADTATRKIRLETAPYSINQTDYENVDFITKSNWNKLSDWITFPDGNTYTIESGETIFMKFRIYVPDDGTAIGGTQSASIMLTDVFREDGDSSVGLQTEKRYLWLVTADINGADMRVGGKTVSWKADGPFVFDNSNGLKTRSIIENVGNVSFEARYKVIITDLFRNDAVAYEDDAKLDILPESKRSNEFKWEHAPALGWFQITETIEYLDKDETYTKMVFIFPLWLLIISCGVIIMLVAAIILKVRKHKEEKENN